MPPVYLWAIKSENSRQLINTDDISLERAITMVQNAELIDIGSRTGENSSEWLSGISTSSGTQFGTWRK